MAESNNSKKLHNSLYEIDILEIGGHHDRKRGKGSENRQPTLLVLSTSEDNEYPQHIKLHALPDYIESYLKEKCIFNDQQFLIAMVIELFSPGKINTVRKQYSRLYR